MSRDKDRSLNEKHQSILSALLKDEDNKYCVDCDAKGPRWASWNLGIFLCIRCAGIHRNLGVHISRVKSVNLDTWTQEQIAMMQEMGNSRARAVYEANLPDHFRRPQTDSSLEAFIRAKYEAKKYIAKEWVPPQPKVSGKSSKKAAVAEPEPVIDEKKEKKKSRTRPASSTLQLPPQSKTNSNHTNSEAAKVAATKPPPKIEAAAKESAAVDLLGLALQEEAVTSVIDTPAVAPAPDDPFGEFLSNTTTSVSSTNHTTSSQLLDTSAPTENGVSSSSLEQSLMGENSGGAKSTKESILALYGSASSQHAQQQQMFGVPGGMYMPPQQQQNQQAYGMMGNMMQGNMGMAQQPQQGNMGMVQQPQQGNMGMVQQPQQGNMGMVQQPQQGNMGMVQQQQQAANMMPGMQQMMMAQNLPTTAMYPFGHVIPQNMMMGGPMAAPGMMPGQAPNNMMMGGANMYNMGGANMYNMQQAQMQQLQQVQQQMAGMKIGGQQGMMGYPQQSTVAAGAGGWSNQQSGHTLSNNLWQ